MKKNKKTLYSISVLIALLFISLSSCKKKEPIATPLQTGTVTDIDNNTYKTVKIGNQWWMAENLRVTLYRNGRPMQHTTLTDVDSIWAQETVGTYCEFDNNTDNVTTYGLLYNWYAATDTNNIAPVGWHVPSDDDWKILENYLGMSIANTNGVNWRGTDEANKLKDASAGSWFPWGDISSTNESGFTALPGCCRLFNGTWGDPSSKNQGFWWTSTAHEGDGQAWFRNLDYKKTNVFRYHVAKTYGMSIRCVKD